MSERKQQEFGHIFLAVIAGHLETQPRQIFADTSFQEQAPQRVKAARAFPAEDSPYDKELFERLRAVRRELAEARGLPAYMILHDASLRHMARVFPKTEDELAQIPRVGAKRASDFGEQLLAVITDHVRSSPQRPG